MMCSIKPDFLQYPDWYRLERETGTTINKLTNTKELSFYLKNSNEFIRRLAILRINDLKLKDSISVLMEVMDDLLESQMNKELAAWTIKSISSKWGMDIYINHKLLNKYYGDEKSIDIMRFSIYDNWSNALKFEFSENFLKAELDSDTDNLRQSEDLELDFSFSTKEWFFELLEGLICSIENNWMKLPGIVLRNLRKFIVFIVPILVLLPAKTVFKGLKGLYKSIASKINDKKLIKQDRKNIKREYSRNLLDSNDTKTPYRSIFEEENVTFSESLKKAVFKAAYVILTPLRLVLRYKKSVFTILLLAYLSCTYTNPGRNLVYKYTGMDIRQTQTQAIKYTRSVIDKLVLETENILKVFDNKEMSSLPQTTSETNNAPIIKSESKQLKFIVTANKGLYLRESPDSASKKPAIGLLKYNSTVIYLNINHSDKNGVKWYLVKALDGKEGWASSKYLKEVGSDK
ncbi:SH3 domain-containing protein [Pseudobacteroides cellulosolvens]|uniref:SH3 domain protein n=1 Tax=Pseudobacteroides cellulosolvens ATCC 35603 = DSM 2933 TaxID=398512 RepID=A0A0L6JK86_9FIRM|nr:SH3 domain-containing protein [Pseudobacteroides cellulosolvens]KNY26175.1 SH3 domain protein [Pseudobacteroides cellulosolvens ATCC 35603 = DSM 2933]